MSLNFQAKKVESKRTIWAYPDGNSIGKWQFHKPAVTVTDDDEGVNTNTERHTRTPSISGHSSRGATTCDSALVSCQDTPLSEIRHTPEHQTTSQNPPHTNGAPIQSESRAALIEGESKSPTYKSMCEKCGWETTQCAKRGRSSLK